MKKNIKYLMGLAVVVSTCLSTTSCIDETEPTSGLTQNQIDNSPNTISAMMMALPARANVLDARTGNFDDYAFGYGALMHLRDVQTGDMAIAFSNYDHFQPWEIVNGINENTARAQWPWNYSYESIMASNKLIGTIGEVTEESSTQEKAALGVAYAYRALNYLDMAREYEFLPNDKFSNSNLVGLTVPIVDENTTEEMAKNNPRATHEKMAEFILSDLDKAEELIPFLDKISPSDKTLPHLAAVYGLKARYYMWNEDYTNAAQYALNAIKASKMNPITYDKCLEVSGNQISGYTKTCFNTLSEWMWGVKQTSENATVKTGIINWTSWMAPDARFGYANAGVSPCMDKNLAQRFSDNDWRQFFYDMSDPATPGLSHKFQPNEGNVKDSKIGAASAYPLMRVEEMWFIYMEALAHDNPAQGKALLEQWMNKYRDLAGTYTCPYSDKDGIIDEIVAQKRIELWGEGQSFFDIKRLNMSVTRGYSGTNFFEEARLNTKGRPAWMNWVIVKSEANNNKALVDMNNPDPTGQYQVWTEE